MRQASADARHHEGIGPGRCGSRHTEVHRRSASARDCRWIEGNGHARRRSARTQGDALIEPVHHGCSDCEAGGSALRHLLPAGNGAQREVRRRNGVRRCAYRTVRHPALVGDRLDRRCLGQQERTGVRRTHRLRRRVAVGGVIDGRARGGGGDLDRLRRTVRSGPRSEGRRSRGRQDGVRRGNDVAVRQAGLVGDGLDRLGGSYRYGTAVHRPGGRTWRATVRGVAERRPRRGGGYRDGQRRTIRPRPRGERGIGHRDCVRGGDQVAVRQAGLVGDGLDRRGGAAHSNRRAVQRADGRAGCATVRGVTDRSSHGGCGDSHILRRSIPSSHGTKRGIGHCDRISSGSNGAVCHSALVGDSLDRGGNAYGEGTAVHRADGRAGRAAVGSVADRRSRRRAANRHALRRGVRPSHWAERGCRHRRCGADRLGREGSRSG